MRLSKLLSGVLIGAMAVVVFAVAVPRDLNARILNVPADYPKVQEAIDAAIGGDTVLVAGGRYAPSTNGEAFPIDMKNGVRLFGAGAATCTLDAQRTDRVILGTDMDDTTTTIDGFTIMRGQSTGPPGAYGGGIRCEQSSPTISNNVITQNTATWAGGAIYCVESSPNVISNVIAGNSTEYFGGGITFVQSSATIANNIIIGNRSNGSGGGLQCEYSSSTIINNVIAGNSAYFAGGGIWCMMHDSSTITNNIISGNHVDCWGGGIECHYHSRPTITNNVITGNGAGQYGGGICCWLSFPAVTNNVITDNSADANGGGIHCRYRSTPTVTNNIITGNEAGGTGGGIYCHDSSPTITYDDVWGNTPNNYAGCGAGTGCISADPLFVDPSVGDYHLQRESRCIDAGDNDAPGLPEFDFDGNPRIMDGDGDGIAIVDMGAFEYQCQVPVILATGGGWIPGEPHDPGDRRTFGFNVHSDAGMTWGQLQFNDHGTRMRVHSDTIKILVIQPGDTIADFSGDCRVDGVSGYTFECEVMDGGEPGRGVDSFSIDVCDADGSLYYSAGGVLGGGNIQVHISQGGGFAKGGSEQEEEPDPNPSPPCTMGEGTQVLLSGERLSQNSPNPFTNRTTISFHLIASGYTSLEIYDITGRLVATLVDGKLSAGAHSVTWEKDGTPSGIYFYRLVTGDFTAIRKMVVLR